MNYLLLWLLLGSLNLNLMWMLVHYKTKKQKFGLIKGLTFGLLLGPISGIVVIYKVLKK
jgi:hypothetical protein